MRNCAKMICAIALLSGSCLTLLPASCLADVVVFSEDFESSPAIRDDGGASLGGSSTNANHREIAFGEWVGRQLGNGNASYLAGSNGTNVLEIDSGNANRRGVGVIIDPNTFLATGSGNYVLTFDVDSYSGLGSGSASVWAGSGYNLAAGSTDNSRLILDTAEPNLRDGLPAQLRLDSRGTAIVSELADTTFTSVGTQSVAFNYDGSSAVALIIGTDLGAEAHIDNIVIEYITSVPEPGSLLLFGICISPLLRRRRK